MLGEELVPFLPPLEKVGSIIRAHHERFDGTGYPDRLAGDQIPWLSRILAVAIAAADTSNQREGLDALKQSSGAAFDPAVVRALLAVLPKTALARRHREVPLAELCPGMVLAKAIYTASGLLLVPAGQPLTGPVIDKLCLHHRLHPIAQTLLVYC